MKLRFSKPTFPGQDHVVVSVEHGANNEKLFTDYVKLGGELDVTEDIGCKIMSQYRGLFEMLSEDKSLKDVQKK